MDLESVIRGVVVEVLENKTTHVDNMAREIHLHTNKTSTQIKEDYTAFIDKEHVVVEKLIAALAEKMHGDVKKQLQVRKGWGIYVVL